MTERHPGTHIDTLAAPVQDPALFGPQPADVGEYKALLTLLDTDPGSVGFDARVNAEVTSVNIDRGALVLLNTNPEIGPVGIDRRATMQMAQQRYIAGVLGLQVNETKVMPSAPNYATASVTLPDTASLPPLPTRQADGGFIAPDGQRLPQVQADALHTAHFIAANHEAFSKPHAFEEFFKGIVQQAETGQLTVPIAEPRGALSMARQVARILGYEVSNFVKTADGGSFVMPVRGIRPGFDAQATYFKNQERFLP